MKLAKINEMNDPIEKACEYFSWATKAQLYWDGNKRTSTVVANAILIKEGVDVFTIDEDTADQFNEKLLILYRDNNASPLKQYIKQQIDHMSEKFSFEQE